MLGRVLSVAGDSDPALAGSKVHAFRFFLLLYGCARSWLWVELIPFEAPLLTVSALVMTAAFGLALVPRWAYLGPRIAIPAMLYQVGMAAKRWCFKACNR